MITVHIDTTGFLSLEVGNVSFYSQSYSFHSPWVSFGYDNEHWFYNWIKR